MTGQAPTIRVFSRLRSLAMRSAAATLPLLAAMLTAQAAAPVYLTGIVLDDQGRTLAGVELIERGVEQGRRFYSDAAGRFHMGPYGDQPVVDIEARLQGHTSTLTSAQPGRSSLVLTVMREAALWGRVIDARTKRPLSAFAVALRARDLSVSADRGHGTLRGFERPDGGFELTGVAAGPTMLIVRAQGYQQLEHYIDVPAGGRTPLGVLALEPGVTLRGRVIERSTGRPLPGAQISYESDLLEYSLIDLAVPPERTDAKGEFVLEGVPAGAVTVTADAPGYLMAIRRVTQSHRPLLELALSRGAMISGRLLTAEGAPALQGNILLEGAAYAPQSTDGQGRFAFTGLAAGTYTVRGNSGIERTAVEQVTVTAEQQRSGIELTLHEAASVRGQITGAADDELAKVRVIAFEDDAGRPNASFDLTVTNTPYVTDGSYRIRGLPSGSLWLLAISDASRRSRIKRIDVPDHGELQVDFDFTPQQRLSGRVTSGGQPVVAPVLELIRPEHREVVAGATGSRSGDYVLEDVPNGNYRLQVNQVWSTAVAVKGDTVRNVELPAHQIAGRVIDAATREPLSRVIVRLDPLQPGEDAGPEVAVSVDGEYMLPAVPEGLHGLSFYHAGYELGRQQVAVSGSTRLDMALRRGPGVLLRAHTSAGQSLSWLRVAELQGGGEALVLSVDIPGGEGELPRALYGRTLRFSTHGVEPITIVAWDGEPLDLVMTPRRR